jgi:hypothetical protein
MAQEHAVTLPRPRDPPEPWLTEEGPPQRCSNGAVVLQCLGSGSDDSERNLGVERCSVTCTRGWEGFELVCPRRTTEARNRGIAVALIGVDRRAVVGRTRWKEGASYSHIAVEAGYSAANGSMKETWTITACPNAAVRAGGGWDAVQRQPRGGVRAPSGTLQVGLCGMRES